jgi:hypothetical protein
VQGIEAYRLGLVVLQGEQIGNGPPLPGRLELRIARSTNSTGFMVGFRSLRAGFLICHTSPWSRSPHQWRRAPSGQRQRIGSYWRW